MWEQREGRRLPGFPIWADCWADYKTPIDPDLPDWKRSHLRKNYEFYAAHRPDTFDFGTQPPSATYRQLGNCVNVGVAWHIMREQVRRDEDILKTTAAGQRILHAIQAAPDSPDAILATHQPPSPL